MNLTQSKNQKSGFTLIELLIVVSIIAILSVLGMVAYTTFIKNARDAKRQADLKFIQSALEEYHGDQTYYPRLGILSCPASPDGAYRWKCSLTNSGGSKVYLIKIPSDPTKTNTANYTYQPLPSGCDNSTTICTSYCVYASSDNLSNRTEDSKNCPVPATINNVSYNYAVTRP